MTSPGTGTSPLGQHDWLERLKQNRRVLTIAGLAAALLAGVIWLYATSQQRKEAFAAQELARARSAAEAGNLPLASNDLTRLIERFRGTRASDEAVILLNQLRLLQGQAGVAVTELEEFVRRRRPEYVRASAYGLLGGALEDLGRYREAGEAYRSGSEVARLDYLKAQYLLDAARAQVAAGDTAAARAAYAEVVDRFGELDQAVEARLRLAELGGEVRHSSDF